jgi:epsin
MIARGVRNVIYNYTDAQRKVRSATSNDAWGPSPALMHEIADLTDNIVAYSEIMPSKLFLLISLKPVSEI